MTATVELTKDYKFGFNDGDQFVYKAKKGLSEEVVRDISTRKREPEWMLDFRLKALRHFLVRPMPTWGPDLSALNFDDIFYYVSPGDEVMVDWNDVPEKIKNTFDKLGIPEAEQKFLSGVTAQYDSLAVYHSIEERLTKLGIIFTDTDTGFRENEDIFKKYFSTLVPPNDNKFAALNSAVWSGGSFLYVPKGVKLDIPVQAYFRINTEKMGQFERTLIIAEEDSEVTYIEGCSAPSYSRDALHSAVVEIIVKPRAKVKYITIQNWSNDVYNLVTKRASVAEDGVMEWIDFNGGSGITMKYPSCYLASRAHGSILSLAFAGPSQTLDTGGKVMHLGEGSTSTIVSKSVSLGGGITTYRGHVKIHKNAIGSRSTSRCDALLLDDKSQSSTVPYADIECDDTSISHEASVSSLGAEQLFYLQSRGISETDAAKMIVNGFIDPVVKLLPMEFAIELNRLVELQMDGSVG